MKISYFCEKKWFIVCKTVVFLLQQRGPPGMGRGRGRGGPGGSFDGPGGPPRPGGRGRGGGGGGGFSDNGFQDETTYNIPAEKCGLVIGKGE